MSDTDGSICSRRSFVKNAIVASSVAMISRPAYTLNENKPEVQWLTLSEASHLVRTKKISPVELTQACLRRIEQLNPKLNAFITVMAESALAEARAAEAEIQRGQWR